MAGKRKRQDEDQSGLRPMPVLLEALKGGDMVAVQSAVPQLHAYVKAARKAPEAPPAKMLEKQLVQRKSMPELLTALDFALSNNNKSLISSLCHYARSLLSVRIVNLASFQHELGLELLDKAAPAMQKALQPGHNECNAAALSSLGVLVRDLTEERWSTKARQVWSIVSADAKNLVRLLGIRHAKAARSSKNSDIRTLVLGIFVPLLSPNSPSQIREDLLSIKGLLSVAMKGLPEDEPPVVYGFLHALFHGGLQGPRISIDQRCAVAEATWQSLLQLTAPAYGEKAQYARRFLLAAITSIASTQQQNTSSSVRRRTLSALLTVLRPGDSEVHSELALALVKQSPELLNSFWQRLYPSLDPRLSSRWIAVVTLATRLICVPPPSSLQTASFESIMDSCFPLTFSQAWSSKGLAFENPLVSYLVALFLIASLQKTQTVIELLKSQPSTRTESMIRRIQNSLAERLPDPKTVINLLQKFVTEPSASSEDDSVCLFTYLRLIKLYHQLVPGTAAALRFDFTKLVDSLLSQVAPQNPLHGSSQLVFFQLALIPGIQINWFKGAGSNTPMYQLCRLLVSTPTAAIANAAHEALFHTLARSNLFEPDQELEITIWICALRGTQAGEEEAAALVAASSLQKASASVFRCIEETDGMDLGLGAGRQISPLVVGWLQQLAYLSEHRKEDKVAMGHFASRVINGYLATHSKTTAKRLRSLASKSCDVLKKPKTPQRASDGAPSDLRRLFDLDAPLEAKQIVNQTSGLLNPVLGLRARFMVNQSGTAALPALHRLLQASSAPSLISALVEDGHLSGLERRSLQGSAEDKEAFADLIGVVARARLSDSELTARTAPYLAQLWESAVASPAVHATVLLHLLPSSTGENRKQLLKQMISSTPSKLQPSDVRLWSALAQTLSVDKDATPWSANLKTILVDLSASHQSTEASAAIASYISRSLPAGFRTVASHGDHRAHLEPTDARALAHSWISALLAQQQPLPPPHEIRPALAISSTAAGLFCDSVKVALKKGRTDFSSSLLKRLTDNADILAREGSLTPLVPSLNKALVDLFENDMKLACQLATVVINCDSDAAYVTAQVAVDWLSSLSPSTVTADLIETVTALTSNLDHPSAAPVLSSLADKCYLWLVRRFAEDDVDSEATTATVQSLNMLLLSKTLTSDHLKDHLVAPVVTAAIQNRFLDTSCMRLVAESLSCVKSSAAVQWAQQVMAHKDLRRGVSATADSRPQIIRVMLSLLKRLGKFDTPPELYATLLSCYGGTLDAEDTLIKQSLKRAELSGLWSLSQNLDVTSLRLKGMTEVASGARTLAVLDPTMAYASCIYISSHQEPDDASQVYDPEFILSMLAAFISAPGIDVQDFLALVRANVLGVAVCGTASTSRPVALASDRLLARLRLRLQGAEFTEKEEILLALHHSQLWSGNESASTVSALFLTQCCRVVAVPEDSRYPVFLRYLLQRSEIDFSDVPLLYQMLYSTEQGQASEERHWLLQLLRDGICQPKDWLALRRRQTWDLLAGLFLSEAASASDRKYIFEFLARAVHHDVAVSDLTRRSGILSFLQQAACYFLDFDEDQVFSTLYQILTRIRPERQRGKLWLDALQTIERLAEGRLFTSGWRVRCYRAVVRAVRRHPSGSSALDGQLNTVLYQVLKREVFSAAAHQEQESIVALLHDVVLRASELSVQLVGASTARLWEGVLQEASSQASVYSPSIRNYWLQQLQQD